MANIQNGKLPLTHPIRLESNPDQWGLFAKKLITQFSTFGLIDLETRTVKIEIEMESIYSPEQLRQNNQLSISTNFSSSQHKGIQRIEEFIFSQMYRRIWIMSGYIKGQKRIPIVVIHYEFLNLSYYSQQPSDEKWEGKFLDGGFSAN